MVRRRRPGIALALFERVVAKQILVVDDEAYLRDVHVLVLSAAGYAATALATAVEALTRLADIRPDLILLDMSLPGMDGREFLKRLRASAQWSRMVVIVTYDENGGFWDHVPPPAGPGWGDRWGPGTRIPAIIVSPFARRGYVDKTPYDTTSIIKLITRRFVLEPLSGVREKAGDLTKALELAR